MGNPDWVSRVALPTDRLLLSSAANLSLGNTTQQPSRESLRKQSSKPDIKDLKTRSQQPYLVLTAYTIDRQIEYRDMNPLYVDMKIASAFYRGSGLNDSARSDSLRSYNCSLKTDRDLVKYRANNPFNADDVKYSKSESKNTDTPQFKAWFGDSKIFDTDGNPKIALSLSG